MFLSKYETQIYTALRIVSGFLFLWHGSQKLFDFPPSGMQMPMAIAGTAGPIEFAGGFLIMIGFLTRWAAFITSGQMAVAYWMAHGYRCNSADCEPRRVGDALLLPLPIYFGKGSRKV